ncbi:hypothetical protein FSARC_6013 [Fusarium sarcochroum]|uniref:Heterokaryon incompatibility domain-containing protein n=1 Tax=Fusarium sarcochroum TaxID=1208366 RepID=A0A8H4TYI6_9HYPO|nr:hypothetical protein FSARC_6013 [Fusarium sarcochroum]
MDHQLYSRLPDGHFRLIKLFPGNWADPLEAELFEADRSSSYVALSYTWGRNRRLSKEVALNGVPKGITINLDLALRTLRGPNPIIIWVDALCINQDDVADKSEQVALMHQIFHWATHVQAYVGEHLSYDALLKQLGPSEPFQFSQNQEEAWEEIHTAFSELEAGSSGLSIHQQCRCIFGLITALSNPYLLARLKTMRIFSQEPSRKMETKQRNLFEWLRMFVIAPWWGRMWIIQEVGVARKLLLSHGKVTVPFQIFEKMVDNGPSVLHLARENQRVLDLLIMKVKWISDLQGLQKYESISAMTDSGYFEKSLGSPLLWLLRTFRHRQASEPRDKVHALGHLLKKLDIGTGSTFETDYGTSVATLFSRVVVHIIRDTGLFWLTSADLVAKSRDSLPSWVPNWADDFRSGHTNDHFWRIRLCHNASNLTFKVHTPTESPPASMDPPEYYNSFFKDPQAHLWSKLRGYECEYREPFQPGCRPGHKAILSSTHFFLDWDGSEQRRFQYEWHEPEVQDFTKIENCLKVPSQYCCTIRHVSEPIAPDFSNLHRILDGFKAAHFELFPGDWKYTYANRREILGRVLCFGAVLEGEDIEGGGAFRRLEPYDDPDLAILTYKLSGYSDEVLGKSIGFQDRYREKCLFKLMAECSVCQSTSETCSECKAQAEAKPIPTADALWKDGTLNCKHATAQETAPGNCILLTSEGTIALGPPSSRFNDRISIISGGLCPYVLRRDTNPQYLGHVAFQLVGDCYLDKTPLWDPEKFETVALV